MPRTSEIAFNSHLGELLRKMHPIWQKHLYVEQTELIPSHPRLQPDILVQPPSSNPVILETEYYPAYSVEDDAKQRLGLVTHVADSPVEQAIAVRIPQYLWETQSEIASQLSEATFEYCVYRGSPNSPSRFPSSSWLSGSITDLARCIEFGLISQQKVDASVEVFEQGVQWSSNVINALVESGSNIDIKLGEILNQQAGSQTNKMAMTIVANALTFHETISDLIDVPSIVNLSADEPHFSKMDLFLVWNRILEKINYWPIFKIAMDILKPIGSNTANQIIRELVGVASKLAGLGVLSRHDLTGRMFQRLIADRKFLATFYTRPTSSTLLAELACNQMNRPWQNLNSYDDLRIADFSCGTGTLLSAAYHSMLSRYRHAGGDDKNIHQTMIEQALIAADIMPAAVHLCASQLASVHPSITFNNTRIYTMPYGRLNQDQEFSDTSIGSLDLLEDDEALALFPTGRLRTSGAEADIKEREVKAPHNSIDLVIMNPPFTNPTNHEKSTIPNPAFAGFQTSAEEQKAMSARLRKLRANLSQPAGHGNAGLASNFLDLAHRKVKSGGTIALVLPIALLKGAAWQASRTLIQEHYSEIKLVTIADSGDYTRAFSADTKPAEVLLVANRRPQRQRDEDNVQFVNLHTRPDDLMSASVIANLINSNDQTEKVGYISAGSQILGSYIQASIEEGGCAGIRDLVLARVLLHLHDGELVLPRYSGLLTIPTTRLDSIGKRGLLHRDIGNSGEVQAKDRGPFELFSFDRATSYPILWSHNVEQEHQMVVSPDSSGVVRPNRQDDAERAWKTASRLHITLEIGLNSQRLGACITSERSLGGRSWPNFIPNSQDWEELLALWANSTLGLMAHWWIGSRQHEGRSILTISRIGNLLTIDPTRLSTGQMEHSKELFKQFGNTPLLPANEAYRDPARQALDRSLLVDLLNLPEAVLEPLDNLRLIWCSEPTVHGGKRTAP